MKKFLILSIGLLLGSQLYAGNPADKLLKQLKKINKKGYMFGHQDDTFYGLTWEWEYGRSDCKDLVGDYPAVMGFDLGGIEMDDKKNLDSVPFNKIHDEAIAHYERGGIITFSWHPRNPLTGGTAWDVTSNLVVKSILKGGPMHAKYQVWLKRVADFLLTIKDKDGKPVPIIFRPWHENNGSWFWWGQKLCSAEEFKGLWNMTQDYLYNRGLNNLLFSYSPNLQGDWTMDKYLERYPGDDRVALIGEDAYQWGTEADFVKGLSADLDFVEAFAKKHKKLFALTECGYKNIPDSTWWTRVLKPIMDKHELLYFLPWRNAKKEYFGPAKGFTGDEDFIKLYNAKNTLFLQDIK